MVYFVHRWRGEETVVVGGEQKCWEERAIVGGWRWKGEVGELGGGESQKAVGE